METETLIECKRCGDTKEEYEFVDAEDFGYDSLCESCYWAEYDEATLECALCEERFFETNNPKENIEAWLLSQKTIEHSGYSELPEGLYQVKEYPVWRAVMFSEAKFNMYNMELIQAIEVEDCEGEVCPECAKKHGAMDVLEKSNL